MTKIGIQTHGVNQSIMRKGLRGGGIAKRGTGVALRGGGIAKRGTGVALKGGGRAALRFGSGRTNLLEELGRVEGEHSNRNRRAEISRVHGELNRGYKDGGRIGLKHGTDKYTTSKEKIKKAFKAKWEKDSKLIPSGTKKSPGILKGRDPGREPRGATRKWIRATPTLAAEGGRIGFKKGTDKKWMQKVSASIKKRKTKGKCTPITKPGCTGRALALAKTFKKIAAKNKKA